MTSIATAHWTLVAWRAGRSWRIAAQGPETAATTAPVPPETEFLGIRLSLGTALERLPTDRLVDHDIEFPDVSRHSVRIFGHTMPLPDYDSAEDVVRRLARAGVIVRDPMVGELLRGGSPDATARTVRRHFLSATGLTPGLVRQIERAREAALLIRTGAPIAGVAHDLGYYDQPHLSRSLGRFLGHTATDLRTGESGQLSLLYKT
ncbi:AraC family transcriptional regulator [Streptomyces armeniacus]|uniref:AraC family transcriptional regulator n=2 Tax=Streptomyces armeniacus TaxID=83291 RepID=A0A345Y0T4_9ACTN|nr:AraC family transcriptional regulator [Streptomyces armeniacus]